MNIEERKRLLTGGGDRAMEFVHRVRELCGEFGLTLVAPSGGVFHLGIMTRTMPPEALKVGSLRHISPYFAEIETGDGVFKVVK